MTTIDLTRPDVSPPAPPASPPPSAPPSQGWTAGRTIAVTIGSILAAAGIAVLIAGGVLWGVSGRRDSAGYFHTNTEPVTSQQFALTSDPLDLGADARPSWGWDAGDFVTLRLRAEANDPQTPIFIGVAHTSDVDAYLASVAHDVVVDIDTHPFVVDYETVSGSRQPSPPAGQSFWAASSTGTGQQTLEWTPTGGEWTVVVMNADAHQTVAANLEAGVNVHHLGLIIGTVLVTGLVLTAGGAVLMVGAIRRSRRPMAITTF